MSCDNMTLSYPTPADLDPLAVNGEHVANKGVPRHVVVVGPTMLLYTMLGWRTVYIYIFYVKQSEKMRRRSPTID